MRKSRVVFAFLAVLPVTFACDRERPAGAPPGDTLSPAPLESAAVTPDTVMARDTAGIMP